MTTKADYNSVMKRLSESEKLVETLVARIDETRKKALECKLSMDRVSAGLPPTATMEDHERAANGMSMRESQRLYWANLHTDLMRDLGRARIDLFAAESECEKIHDAFWEERFNDGCRALIEQNRVHFRDIYTALSRIAGEACPMDHFWDRFGALASEYEDFLSSGISDSERVISSPPKSLLLLDSGVRLAASLRDTSEKSALYRVGELVDAQTCWHDELSLRDLNTHKSKLSSDLESLYRDLAKNPQDKARISESISKCKSSIDQCDRSIAERQLKLKSAREALAKLEAVKVS